MRFEYAAPTTVDEISSLKSSGGVLFSGGTDLFVKMRAGLITPGLLVDTKKLKTPGINCSNNLTIYLNTTYTDLLKSGCLRDYRLLEKVLREVGSPQIRNRGTPIGNVGNASPAGDFLLTTYVYDSIVTVAPSMRTVPMREFVKGPGKVSLGPGEFIYSVTIQPLDGYMFYYEKVGRRNALVISIVSIALAVKMEGVVIEDIRVAFGSVGPTIVRLEDLESEMKGEKPSRNLIERMAQLYSSRVKPITDVRASADYRRRLVGNLLIKAFHELKLLG